MAFWKPLKGSELSQFYRFIRSIGVLIKLCKVDAIYDKGTFIRVRCFVVLIGTFCLFWLHLSRDQFLIWSRHWWKLSPIKAGFQISFSKSNIYNFSVSFSQFSKIFLGAHFSGKMSIIILIWLSLHLQIHLSFSCCIIGCCHLIASYIFIVNEFWLFLLKFSSNFKYMY